MDRALTLETGELPPAVAPQLHTWRRRRAYGAELLLPGSAAAEPETSSCFCS